MIHGLPRSFKWSRSQNFSSQTHSIDGNDKLIIGIGSNPLKFLGIEMIIVINPTEILKNLILDQNLAKTRSQIHFICSITLLTTFLHPHTRPILLVDTRYLCYYFKTVQCNMCCYVNSIQHIWKNSFILSRECY